MRLPRLRKTQPDLPGDVAATLELGRGERVLAHAVDDVTGATVVATTWALCVVSPDAAAVSLRRPWHVVDAGVWQHETFLLTVTFVDGTRPVQWTLHDQQTLLPETLRERVQASVVLAQRLSVGERRMARVAIRKDFRTGELVSQRRRQQRSGLPVALGERCQDRAESATRGAGHARAPSRQRMRRSASLAQACRSRGMAFAA